jgi:hypothetical protein
MDTTGLDITAVASIVTALATIMLVVVATRLRRVLDVPQQIANLPQLLRSEYLNREYKDASGRSVLLRETRHEFRRARLMRSSESADPITEAANEDSTWNRYAYEAVDALERVGAYVLAGALPLGFVMRLSAGTIVEDWFFCRELVARMRRDDYLKSSKNIQFRRRHAEWLAYAAILYLSKNGWHGGYLDEIFASQDGGIDFIRRRERELRDSGARLPRRLTVSFNELLR